MAVELMQKADEITGQRQPMEHRLAHDLESVCLVLLHIVRFTCGPAGAIGNIKSSYRISQWHYEHNIEIMKDQKIMDVQSISKAPTAYITEYWAPIAPFITKLIDVVYPQFKDPQNKKEVTYEAFKDILIEARQQCMSLRENPHKYAAFKPPRSAPNQLKKRSRPKSLADDLPERKHLRSLTEDHSQGHLPRNARI